ncbi:MAG: MATE family efflux transporter [Clostridia bacterium]|nr:MATE family efflux transporter [Clostridia bacterium]
MKQIFEGNIKKNFLVFSIPLILSALLSSAHSIINSMMSSNLLGEEALSAIGSTSPLISLISSICWGYGTGFSVYVAMLIGTGDFKKTANVVKINMLFSSLFVLTLSALCIIFHSAIFNFLNIGQDLWDAAFAYFSVYIGGLVIFNLTWCGIYISNALGMTKLPLIASIISNVLNITLNYVFIKFLHFGVEGTALASVISASVIGIFYIVMILKAFKKVGVSFKGIYFDKEEIRQSIRFGVPTTLQQSIMYLCTTLVSPLTNSCGASAIAGYTVGMKIYDLEASIYQNSNKTISTYVAQCMGAKRYSIIKKGLKTGLTQTFTILASSLLPVVIFANVISGLFLDKPDSINYSNIFLQYCLPFVFFNTLNNMFHALFRSTGAGRILVISTLVYAVSRVVFSYVLFNKFEMYGIFAAIVLSWVTEAIFGIIVYFSGKWKSDEYAIATASCSE